MSLAVFVAAWEIIWVSTRFLSAFFFIAWTILGELSVLIYFILWLVIPRGISASPFRVEDLRRLVSGRSGLEIGDVFQAPSRQLIIYAGAGLISWGVLLDLLRLARFPLDNMGLHALSMAGSFDHCGIVRTYQGGSQDNKGYLIKKTLSTD